MSAAGHVGAAAPAAHPGAAAAALLRRASDLVRRAGASRTFAVAVTLAALFAGFATFGMLSGFIAPPGGRPEAVLVLLNVDLALLLGLGALVASRLVRIWTARRRGSIGWRLHGRTVGMFSALAVAPAILVAVFSALFFNLGVQAWFNDRIRAALDRSIAVAEAYARDHREFIRADVLSMVATLNRQDPRRLSSPPALSVLLQELAEERSLTEAVILRGDGTVLARGKLSFVLEFDPLPVAALRRAAAGEVVVMTGDASDRVRALARIDAFVDGFLYVGRFADSQVLNHVARLSDAVAGYRDLDLRRSDIQITFTLFYVIVSLLLLMCAVWLGLMFANRIVAPVARLVAATERVRAGDLGARLPEGPANDELAVLARAFNRMAGQLQGQRAELVEANRQIDDRRLFTEAVLFGVSAGVLGLNRDGRIHLPNRSALELLDRRADDLVGRRLGDAVPEMAALQSALEDAAAPEAAARGAVQEKVSLARGGRARELQVRMTVQRDAGRVAGAVVTFDDVTDLVDAQRAAAWADVARRVAHEIRNPLTPIQLSAERLRRRYRDRAGDDGGVFESCVRIIVRQVGAIRAMVDEFSAFARMPAPAPIDTDLSPVVAEAVSLMALARPDVAFAFAPPEAPVWVRCDAAQVGRALANLLRNAVEAIDARTPPDGGAPEPGRVEARIEDAGADGGCAVCVDDNGRGLPEDPDRRARLTEPYVTARERGTGLGLAIVKKIMEDHDGGLTLGDGPLGGARVRLEFPPRDGPAAPGGPRP